MAKTSDSIASDDPEREVNEGAQPRALRLQAMIWQAKGTMTRSELEAYADELERDGLFDDLQNDSAR